VAVSSYCQCSLPSFARDDAGRQPTIRRRDHHLSEGGRPEGNANPSYRRVGLRLISSRAALPELESWIAGIGNCYEADSVLGSLQRKLDAARSRKPANWR
jgi:hypothetical protein